MTIFRPCIDLHEGYVKQIVGASLSDKNKPTTNFSSALPSSHYAELYKTHSLIGAHLIKLGNGNEDACREALSVWPDYIQVGGGITIENAHDYLQMGASKVIVTSWLFPDARFNLKRLQCLSETIGKDRLVIDLRYAISPSLTLNFSCKYADEKYVVAMNKWQTLTDLTLSKQTFDELSAYASEFLVHAADIEGLCKGIDHELVKKLGEWCNIPCTYGMDNFLNDFKPGERTI